MRRLLTIIAIALMSGLFQLTPAFASAASINLVPNPSVETAKPTNTQLPQNWNTGRWGTNTTSFSYLNNGHNGGRSLSVQMSAYTSGDAKWYFDPVNVNGGSSYTFSDYYLSSVDSEVLAVFIDGSNNWTYKYLASTQASPLTWQQFSKTIAVPANTVKMTVFHMIYGVGSLQTDDYSLTQISTTQVNIVSPSNSQILSNTKPITVSANDVNGINNVQIKLDGQNLGSALSNAPYTYSWDTKTASDGNHSLVAVATNSLGQSTNSDPVAINVNNTPPTSTNTSLMPNSNLETVDPANSFRPLNWRGGKWGTNSYSNSYLNTGRNSNHSVKTEITQYTSGAAYWYNLNQDVTAGKTYKFTDYFQSNISSEIDVGVNMSDGSVKYIYLGTVAASPSTWTKFEKQFTAPDGAVSVNFYHEIYAVGWLNIDDYSLVQNNQTQVTITSADNGQTISGSVSLNSTATDDAGISSVQYKIDGQNLGSSISNAPYTYNFDSTSLSNGSHSLSAVATNVNGLSTTSPTITVNINNQPPSSNLIKNASFELADSTNPNKPASWTSGSWGTNVSSLSYLNTGHSGTRSTKAEITQYTNGASHWITNTVNATPGQLYDYSDYYKSNTTTQVIAAFKMSDGTTKYNWLGSPVQSSGGWTKFRKQFSAPAGSVSVNIYHELYSVGWVISDDYNLDTFSYQGFKNPIISITNDDGFASFYKNGLPLLNKYGFNSTEYILSDDPNRGPNYMSDSMITSLYNSGHEIGSHTISHLDLSTLNDTDLSAQLVVSQNYLQNLLGVPINNFAAPYGNYNQNVLDKAALYYRSFRTVDSGYNAKNNFDPYRIMVQNLHSDTTLAEFQSWVAQAKATNTWLVLVYHQIDPNTSAGIYNTYPSDFDAQLNVIKNSGIPVKTVNQALDELIPQL